MESRKSRYHILHISRQERMGIFARSFPKKMFFWTLDFSFVWTFTDFSRLCNLYAYLVDKIFLCFVKKPIFFRTFSFPIIWKNRSFRKNKIESGSTKHTWTAQRCQKNKEYSRKREIRGTKEHLFWGKFSRKCPYRNFSHFLSIFCNFDMCVAHFTLTLPSTVCTW